GYFLKLMKYQSGKDLAFYVSPLLIGRVGWDSSAAAGGKSKPEPWRWMAIAVGVMFVLSFIRWMTGLRKSLSLGSRSPVGHERPTEEIAPDALAAWLEIVPDEDSERGEEPDPR